MGSLSDTGVRRNMWRRLYVFVAVALAVFVLGMNAIGFICHGFMTSEALNSPATGDQAAELQNKLASLADEYDASRKATASALADYDSALGKCLNFLNSHFAEMNERYLLPGNDNSPQLADARSTEAAHQKMIANPQWKQLHDRFAELEKERTKLLVNLTTEHPSVLAVDADIEDVKDQLQTVPPVVAGDSGGTDTAANSTAVATPALPIDIAALAARMKTDETEFHKLADALYTSQQKYRQAAQVENSIWRRQANELGELAVATARPIPPPVGADPRQAIAWCVVAAGVVGFIVARKASISERVFKAPSAVRQVLELPILGFISRAADQLARERPKREPKWVRRCLLGAELAIAALVILLAAAAVVDQHFLKELLADPLAACSKQFWC